MVSKSCEICQKEITVSSINFHQLCIICGTEFLVMMRAMRELEIEMAGAYGIANSAEELDKLPGVPLGEIAIRMELNRLGK